MSERIPDCTMWPKHKWVWEKNFWEHHVSLRSARSNKRGLYRCECGEVKIWRPQTEPTGPTP